MLRKYHCLAFVFLLGLFFPTISCTPQNTDLSRDFAETAVITGIPVDDELRQLLSQVVPYDLPEKNALPKEKRFFYNLNTLINDDLADQDAKYKLAACKLALRQALAINTTVDSIQVRRYPPNRVREPYGDYSAKYGPEVQGNFWWVLGGEIEDSTQWKDYRGEVTSPIFVVNEGKITEVDINVSVNACGGMFSSCCDTLVYPSGLNDAWFQHFVDLGKRGDFPLRASEYTPKIVESYSANLTSDVLDLTAKKTAEGIAELAVLKDLKHLIIDTVKSKDADAMRDAFFELFPKLPNLQGLDMNAGPVTEAQMQKLGECQNLKFLSLTGVSPETPKIFEPINQLKKLEKLSVKSDTWHSWENDLPYVFKDVAPLHHVNGQPASEIIKIDDLPNLTDLYIVGTTQGRPLSLTNVPNLTLLKTDAPRLEGDVFTERTPRHLKVLVCAGLEITEEQMRPIAALEQLESLGLYGLRPKSLNAFTPFREMKALKSLALVFTDPYRPDQYRNETLTTPPAELAYLTVRFPGGYSSVPRNHLKIPKLAANYDLYVEYATMIDDLPTIIPGRVLCRSVTMSYEQFKAFFQNDGNVDPRYRYNKFDFQFLTLTDITEDDLFVGFTFPFELNIMFDQNMREPLKGKTFHFEKCDRLGKFSLAVPFLPDVDIRVSELKNLRSYQVTRN
ncbi:MAG: hypothetical protein FWD31_14725 [Planctomycetaceae bacterium]|nr:hypothetical protein [Planctomycetaceae bacterium]